MLSSTILKQFRSEARLVIERQLADAEILTGIREAVTAQGGDWSSLKALIKAEIQDDQDDTGERKRVKKVIERSAATAEYAEVFGLNLNEENYIRSAAE